MKERIFNFFKKIDLKIITKIIGIFIIIIIIFEIGVFVGFYKASFGKDWSNNYKDNFIGVGKGPKQMQKMRMLDFKDAPNANGAIGRIIKKDSAEIVVVDEKDMMEKIVVVDKKTNIMKMKKIISFEDLSIDDFVIILGKPNSSGKIEAKLIRLIPNPELMKNFKD
jgi:hypothetical protein